MELLSMAKHSEKEGIQFYTDLADQADTREIRGIFSFLANEERCHYNLFDSWQKNDPSAWLDDEVILDNLEKICQKFIHYFKVVI
jgi:rubrerythrin